MRPLRPGDPPRAPAARATIELGRVPAISVGPRPARFTALVDVVVVDREAQGAADGGVGSEGRLGGQAWVLDAPDHWVSMIRASERASGAPKQ